MYKFFFKRFFDFIIAVIGFIILSPVFIIVALYLYVVNQRKPFFYQLRPGQYGNVFKIIKFKTMNDKKAKDGNLLSDADRITTTGGLIRKLSLDEIPQLLNVMKGDMSLIGPRPLLPEYLSYYSDFQNKRHEVKPGISGWAQVNGRNAISWEKKFEFDVWYVDNLSFLLDLKIFFLTVKKVFSTKDISPEGQATMPRFDDLCENNNNLNIYNND